MSSKGNAIFATRRGHLSCGIGIAKPSKICDARACITDIMANAKHAWQVSESSRPRHFYIWYRLLCRLVLCLGRFFVGRNAFFGFFILTKNVPAPEFLSCRSASTERSVKHNIRIRGICIRVLRFLYAVNRMSRLLCDAAVLAKQHYAADGNLSCITTKTRRFVLQIYQLD